MNNLYLIKHITPWMINELLAFSQFVQFRLVLLRTPPPVIKHDLAELEKRSIEIFITPFKKIPDFKKSVFCFLFFIKNFQCFWGIKNFVFGIKSIYWFIMMDHHIIPENSSIHAQFATQPAIISLMFKKFQKNVKYYFTFHAYDIYYKNRWFYKLIKESYKAFTISKYALDYIKENYHSINYKKISLSKLGTFLPNKVYNKKKKNNGFFTLGFLGRFVEEKNIFLLLEEVKKLVKLKIKIKLFMAGEGPLKDKILNFIRKEELNNNILYEGLIYGKQKEIFFKKIDIFILPSNSEGLPVVLMEALSYSIPIISTNICGIPELCKNNYNGFLIPPRDPSALSAAIMKFYRISNSHFQKFRCNAFESVKAYDVVSNSRRKLKELDWH